MYTFCVIVCHHVFFQFNSGFTGLINSVRDLVLCYIVVYPTPTRNSTYAKGVEELFYVRLCFLPHAEAWLDQRL